ncbi:MAG: IS66 family transposase [Desulfobacterales bacterium]|nr:IS66 family transposase [Desulfobacterales bacterium]
MNLQVNKLPEDPAALKQIVAELLGEYNRSQEKIQHLEEHIRLLQNEIFGRKSEKHRPENRNQILLFEDAADLCSDEPDTDEEIVVGSHIRNKRGRKPLPADLPRVEIVHDLDDSEKLCSCGCELKRIGEEVSEKLDYVPATFQVERHIRYKYACPECEGVEDDGPTVKIAPAPPQLIEKSNATSGLVAHIVCSKFEDALPLYRQEKIFARLGVELPRSTMCSWLVKVAEKHRQLVDLLSGEIRSGPVVNADETTLQVLQEPDKADTSKSYMWLFRGGDPEHPSLVFRYHPTRSGKVALEYLSGYQGYVQCDGYGGYDALGREKGVTLVGCWAHARRKFDKVIKARSSKKKQGAAEKAVKFIAKLYQVEKKARELELDPVGIRQLRREESEPVLDEFKGWLEAKLPLTPPKGLLGTAIGYTLGNWKRLVRYLEDGRLRPDNNLAENAIRPFVVGRKNWLFAGHPNGADAAAFYFSLIETAKANGLKPYYYLRYLFDRLPLVETEEDYKNLLPQQLTPEMIAFPA